MVAIKASLVRELRNKTGAGMMDCKKALQAVEGELEAAVDWLRKKGLSSAAKKSGRVAADGLVGVATGHNKAAMVEVNAETDFVARNESFQKFVGEVAKKVLEVGDDIETLRHAKLASGRTVADELTQLVATVGENMTLRRAARLEVSKGVVATYVHGAVATDMGRIGVIVALESDQSGDDIVQLGRKIGMHVAATRPASLDVDSLDPKEVEHERKVLSEQAKASGKPEAIIHKMVDGRIRKFYQEVVLLEQVWVHDGETRVKDVLKKSGVKLVGFERFSLGEGLEKKEDDFVEEVNKAAKS